MTSLEKLLHNRGGDFVDHRAGGQEIRTHRESGMTVGTDMKRRIEEFVRELKREFGTWILYRLHPPGRNPDYSLSGFEWRCMRLTARAGATWEAIQDTQAIRP